MTDVKIPSTTKSQTHRTFIKHWFASAQGRRPTMEDIHLTSSNEEKNWKYWIVCDGHGGRAVVDYLQFHLGNQIDSFLKSSNITFDMFGMMRWKLVLEQFVLNLDRTLFDSLGKKASCCGCTFLMVLYHVPSHFFAVVHLGDSRAMVCHDFKNVYITKDHKPNEKKERQRIETAGGYVSKDKRVNKNLALSRALGDFSLKFNKPKQMEFDPLEGAVCAIPEVEVGYLSSGIFVIACDGVWDVLSNSEVHSFLTQIEKKVPAQNPAESLVKQAYEKQSSDNLSCFIVLIQQIN